MIIGKGEVIAWSWRQLRERSVRREEEADGDGWTTSEVGENARTLEILRKAHGSFRAKAR